MIERNSHQFFEYKGRTIEVYYSTFLNEWVYLVKDNSTPFSGTKITRELAIALSKKTIDLFEATK